MNQTMLVNNTSKSRTSINETDNTYYRDANPFTGYLTREFLKQKKLREESNESN